MMAIKDSNIFHDILKSEDLSIRSDLAEKIAGPYMADPGLRLAVGGNLSIVKRILLHTAFH